MFLELLVVIEPPQSAGIKNKIARAARPQFFQIGDDLIAVEWIALINAVLEEMPAFAVRIIKNSRVAVVRRDDERAGWCDFLQLESEIAQADCVRPIKSSRCGIRLRHKNKQHQDGKREAKLAMCAQRRADPSASVPRKNGCDRDQRKLIPRMTISPTGDVNKNNHGSEPPVKEARIFSGRCDERADNGEDAKDWRQTGSCSGPRDFPVPGKVFNLKSASAEKMIRIIFLCDLVCVPVPDCGREKRDHGEKPEF